ncbi:ornithine carbamoyltransferase [Caldimonas sp. KR1-144]|uniref:ornithine carbamoyltransferase n=1 Tax=Caldimonas sp. KR1-144 TaxID=3400911 RepID=UPI003BFEF652
MSFNLRNRSLLTLAEIGPAGVDLLLETAHELKRAKAAGTEQPRLRGKEIALLFAKTSTRTRCAFEVAAFDQGAHVSFIGPQDSQLGEKESVKDTARVLGRLYDAIEYRGFEQEVVQTLAAHSGVPVYNGLTNEYHPTQVLADFMTMQEHCRKPLSEVKLAYVGDARFNTADSLLEGAAMMGLDFRIGAPRELWPQAELRERAHALAEQSHARLRVTDSAEEAVEGADFVYTDVWVSMGEPPDAWAQRIPRLLPYQVNHALMRATGNPEARFMHCLPALHNRETALGERIYRQFGLDGVEVTEEVFESPASIVWDQAENRLHTIKALLVATLA